jgi:hypothetical protein
MPDRHGWTPGRARRLVAVAAVLAVAGCSFHDPPIPLLPTTAPPAGTSAPPAPTNCADLPSSCGYPDGTNTGVPAGTALTVHNGDLEVETAGAVIDRLDIRGCVRVMAADVTIRRSKITCADWWAIASFGDEHDGGLLVEDVEVDCRGAPASTAIGSSGFTLRRVNLHHCENGVDIDNDVTVEDSYIHDVTEDEDGHADGIQFNNGADVVIRHNTIHSAIGTSAIITGKGGPFDRVTIEQNLLGGGIYTLYCPQEPGSVSFRVLDNRFVRDADYGPWVDCDSIDENRGNVWDDTLTPVSDEEDS